MLLVVFALFGCTADDSATEDSPSEQAAPAAAAPVNVPNTARLLPGSLEEVLPSKGGFALLYANVGKADATILRIGDKTVLIDTGSAESAPQLVAGLNALGVTAIDAVFITHSHGDHLGGLDALAANYNISIVYSPFYSEPDKNGVSRIVKRAEELGLPHQ